MKKAAVAFLVLLLILSASQPARAVRARVLFIGDIMTHIQQLNAAEHKGKEGRTWDFTPQFHRVKPLLANAFTIGNLETTFSGEKRGYTGYPAFNTPDSLTAALRYLGIDLLTLANNHIFDRGAAGARRTAEVLTREGFPWVGLGFDDIPVNNTVLLEAEGLRWAFVNHTYGSNIMPQKSDVHLNIISETAISESLKRAKALDPDVIVACFHWGNEYHYKPSVHQKRAADQALAHGADLVIGTHPHVLQPVEVRIGKNGAPRAIAWSLGNFVSFQRTQPRERTCILSAEFEKDEAGQTRLVRLAAAPLQVILMPGHRPKPRRTEPVYAGTGGNFNHFGLSKSQLRSIHQTGKAVLDFLGAQDEIDEYGFYTLWSSASPDILPRPRRKAPLN
ncbi:MAG: CapA family protein [Fretibacterium sp.]|nr:CapA family protein [Fretibacterium sp.]